MKVIIENVIKEPVLEVGCIVAFGSDIYLLQNCLQGASSEVEFRSLTGKHGACGRKTIEGARNYVRNHNDAQIYSPNEFELVLRRKQ